MDAGSTTDETHEPLASRGHRDPGRGHRDPGWLTVLALAVAATVAAGCTVTSGPDTETVRGILSFGPEGSGDAPATADPGGDGALQGSLEAPDTVRVGESFPVTIRTVGLNGCWSSAGEDVSVDGLTATIVPFDSTGQREDVACTMALTSLLHEVELSFGEAGEAVVRVEGRRVIGREGSETEPLALEETVTVVP